MKSIIKQLYTILLVTVACLTVTGCSDDFKSGLRLDGDVWVNSIRLDEYAGTVDYQNKAIVVGVPYDYDITRMVVTEMNLSEGAKASIAIGETIDFSLPVSLTVKNGDVQMSYTITVKRDEAKILTFKLNDTYVGKVDQLSKTISVVVPLTVDITQLKGTFTVTDGATVTPASGSIQDFTNPVTYTATYRSAVTPYVVTVTQGNVIPTAFVGTASSVSLLTSPEEKAAAQWMMDNVSMSEYISFKDVVDGKVDLGKYTAIWWHFHADNGDNPPLPDDAKAAAEKFKVYYQNGGNLLLTRYATFYIANLGIAKDERVPNNSWGGNEDSPEITSAPWSFLITGSESHPLFQDLRWKDGDKSTVYTIVIRYADVLLMRAEALIQLNDGRITDAISLINEVRSRAAGSTMLIFNYKEDYGVNFKVTPYDLKAYAQDEAMKMLKWERRVEFGMESSRFFDLVRWGEAKDVINAYYVTEASRCSIYKNAGFTENKNEYLPVPFEQISASNGNYTQNFGW